MSTGYEQQGRTAQKQRTRDALVEGARAVLASGAPLSVESAADAAGISRATAYRYFANQKALLVAAHPSTYSASLLPADPPADPWERLGIVLDGVVRIVFDDEPQQRSMLRLSLEHDPQELPLRQGRVIGWLTEALAPLEATLGWEGVRHLVLAIRTAIGIEALVWLVDVAGLSRPEAEAQMRWSVRAIYDGATISAGPGRR